jgi:hypothetical protein
LGYPLRSISGHLYNGRSYYQLSLGQLSHNAIRNA